MLVVPADAEVDVSTRTEHLDDPTPFSLDPPFDWGGGVVAG
jgi:hypothetical protein